MTSSRWDQENSSRAAAGGREMVHVTFAGSTRGPLNEWTRAPGKLARVGNRSKIGCAQGMWRSPLRFPRGATGGGAGFLRFGLLGSCVRCLVR